MVQNREGQRVPEVTFRTREAGQWKEVTSRELFAGKKVVVFALPGAFTPTCSSSHLPRYEELAASFREAGIDEIVCVSVNDAFVMEAWRADQKCDRVRLIPDGNAEFTRAMGMLVGQKLVTSVLTSTFGLFRSPAEASALAVEYTPGAGVLGLVTAAAVLLLLVLLRLLEALLPWGLRELGWTEANAWKDAITFAALITVLLVKPTGMLGQPMKEKV